MKHAPGVALLIAVLIVSASRAPALATDIAPRPSAGCSAVTIEHGHETGIDEALLEFIAKHSGREFKQKS